MKCTLHNQPCRIVCTRCADITCSMCAESIDGSWFCPDCAIDERRTAAGLSYRQFASDLSHEPASREDIHEYEPAES
jgi:hypothetical protein